MKNYFRFGPWIVAGFIYALLVGWARADYVVMEQHRQAPMVSSGPAVMMAPTGQSPAKPVSNAGANFVVLTHGAQKPADPNTNTLLVCLPGHGDTAANFVKVWMTLMRTHPNLIVAVPDISLAAYGVVNNTADIVAAIVATTVAHDHVNPRHVILAGYSQGANEAAIIVSQRPDLFAGYAAFSGGGLLDLLTPALSSYREKMALYYNMGSAEGLSAAEMAFEQSAAHYFGFARAQAVISPRGHQIIMSYFDPQTLHMMQFFDQALAEFDRAGATVPPKPATVAQPTTATIPTLALPPKVALERRRLANPQGANYLFLSPDRAAVSASHPSTLLICLHGPGDAADDFAKNWYALVGSRDDVVVAVANYPGIPQTIKSIIDDAVSRDGVNPRHVILVAHDLGGPAAARVLGMNPELFAGFAALATNVEPVQFTPAWKKNARRLAVYFAVGTNDEMFKEVFAANVNRFKDLDFSHVLAESPVAAHAVTQEEIKHLMVFFDKELAAQDKSAAAAAR